MRSRAVVFLLPWMLGAGVVPLGQAAAVAATVSPILPPANPAANFTQVPCAQGLSLDQCFEVEVDAARAAEGLGPLNLPTNFASLTPGQQVMVVLNEERVDRGLPPMDGLADPLNVLAQQGADQGRDPSFPPYGSGGAGIWAGGNSLMEADFLWMYDDGPGGSNLDCTPSISAGCWGHRDAILGSWPAPAHMGAAMSSGGPFGGSFAALFIGGDTSDAVSFPWSAVTPNLAVALSEAAVNVRGQPGGTTDHTLRASASGAPMVVTFSVSGGTGWSVTPPTCNLGAGTGCDVTLAFRPPATGTFNATLNVTTPNGTRAIPLVGSTDITPPTLAITEHPSDPTTARSAGFSFAASDPDDPSSSITTDCSLDGAAATPCSSPIGFTGLGGGTHTLRVVATDPAGNAGAPASFTWRVDTTAPVVVLTQHPDDPATARSATFSFVSIDADDAPGGLRTTCSLDGAVTAACSSPVSYAGLAVGQHTFSVVSTDPAGNTGAQLFTWTVQGRPGYWMLGSGGAVYAFGEAAPAGDVSLPGASTAAAIASTPSGNGYWVADDRGDVSAFGDAGSFGGHPVLGLGERVTSLSPSPDGHGYWLFTDTGRAFPYGTAQFFGDMSGTRLNGPVLGSVATPSGRGYYMVASDGGIFAFGDAGFTGSMGGRPLNQPIVGLAPSPGGAGYWLVAADGGIFAFGPPFKGSMGSTHLNQSVIGMVAYGDGYLMVARDGGIFDFSTKPFVGSLGGSPPSRPIVGVAPQSG